EAAVGDRRGAAGGDRDASGEAGDRRRRDGERAAVFGDARPSPRAHERQARERGGDARGDPENTARAAAYGQARRRAGNRGGQRRVAQLERRAGQGDGRGGGEGRGVERDRFAGELVGQADGARQRQAGGSGVAGPGRRLDLERGLEGADV